MSEPNPDNIDQIVVYIVSNPAGCLLLSWKSLRGMPTWVPPTTPVCLTARATARSSPMTLAIVQKKGQHVRTHEQKEIEAVNNFTLAGDQSSRLTTLSRGMSEPRPPRSSN
ncbi:hypothetical protein FOQG_12683 [Fusarium oxysporum f. sp. raphani 54005]|nr:hypothetical protein FOVG_13582 [Fusarium oxysporum f. sp. pisi HDV247]EXK83003.1 hypothetical protein FOQG_12683 [Fusarium oxysporum f. sp. raphani 54005]